jgi:hypothetical protein
MANIVYNSTKQYLKVSGSKSGLGLYAFSAAVESPPNTQQKDFHTMVTAFFNPNPLCLQFALQIAPHLYYIFR